MNTVQRPEATPGTKLLEKQAEVQQYLTLLTFGASLLVKCYEFQATHNAQYANIVLPMVKRLHHTYELWMSRLEFNATQNFMIALRNSGFPHTKQLQNIEWDMIKRNDQLSALPPLGDTKKEILDKLLNEADYEVNDLLNLGAERQYFDDLSVNQLFYGYFEHGFMAQGQKELNGNRLFTYAWGFIDHTTQKPYICILEFEQDNKTISIMQDNEKRKNFARTIRSEGDYYSPMARFMQALDEALPDIHPKKFERICVGPFIAPPFTDNVPSALTLGFSIMQSGYPLCLLFEIETIESFGQKLERRFFGSYVREQFFIKDNPECRARQTSDYRKFAIMPHEIAQHIPFQLYFLREITGIISFDQGGALYGLNNIGYLHNT